MNNEQLLLKYMQEILHNYNIIIQNNKEITNQTLDAHELIVDVVVYINYYFRKKLILLFQK